MLSLEENELITRTEPGMPMGDLFRQYWIPAVMSSELQSDGHPVTVRLLGEDLVAFRDTNGKVGLVEESCPHRGTSLAYAINSNCGLQCIYHGWKFNTRGECVEIPSEPPESHFKEKIKNKSYPAFEAGDISWIYRGGGGKFTDIPEFLDKRQFVEPCN